MHGQNIICIQTQLDDIVNEQTIICRQLFTGHVVGSWPIKRKKYLHRMIMIIRSVLYNSFPTWQGIYSGLKSFGSKEGEALKQQKLLNLEDLVILVLKVADFPFQEDKFYYGDVLKHTDVKIKSLLTPDCGASVLEEKVDQLIGSFPHLL